MSKIRVAGFVNDSITDGPGIRFTLFTQGCPRRCPECHNPQTQPLEGGKIYDSEEIFKKIKQNPLLDGVTFSGGEPMIQAESLLPLAKQIKSCGLNLFCYTGYVFEELKNVKFSDELLKYVDVLIDGPYIKEKRDYTLKFKGSTNQRIIDVQKTLKSGKISIILDDEWN
ncbi:MAG: anaerobic ribonucleoside-triphosphate reductase activating protein [Clostridia bacterium]|nr:anaerobic ribonucleoside-triphosphate reductase activating protein [Clostridia bacterium]